MNKVIPINNDVEEIPMYTLSSGGVSVPYSSDNIHIPDKYDDLNNSVTSSLESSIDTSKKNIFDTHQIQTLQIYLLLIYHKFQNKKRKK